jgi:hypothetical protein
MTNNTVFYFGPQRREDLAVVVDDFRISTVFIKLKHEVFWKSFRLVTKQ